METLRSTGSVTIAGDAQPEIYETSIWQYVLMLIMAIAIFDVIRRVMKKFKYAKLAGDFYMDAKKQTLL